ncbi:unnamed protein product [Brachionus calyciflorus]|uniref:Uncharacterized protein n=1 Tax=Brachionus calyciflorus TaxID=104777 RepID=A0A813QDD1_9BILA|nr:unnamed protein product [Brachionus calyciflorus]
MGSCHSSNSTVKSRKKLADKKKSKSKSLLNESIDDRLDSLTLKNNDLSAYIDLNSSIFHKNSMSSLDSTNSNLSSDSQASLTKPNQRSIPVLSRLVYKPRESNIVTSNSSIITTGSSKQSCLTKSISTSPPCSPATTQIKVEPNTDNKNSAPKKINSINRREFSPFRSFIKPPSALKNNSNSSLNKHNQSSSLSSLSSTSSSISNNNNKPRTNLVPPKKLVANKSCVKVSSPSTNPNNSLKASNSNIPSLTNKTDNLEKPVQTNKRLFSPYKFSSTLQKPTVLTENINRENSSCTEIRKNENTSSTSTSKENNNTSQSGLSKLKFSYNKIPTPSKSNLKTISQTKLTKLSEVNCKNSIESSSLLKRDDSAYNSSTSSTVSSSNDQDEIKNKIEDKKNKTCVNNNTSKSSIEKSVGELNQLIVSSSSICSSTTASQDEKIEKLNSKESVSVGPAPPPIFKPPSNLPPVENGEVIVLDIETYRLLLQDLQSCKIILHKLGAVLKEPSTLNHELGQGDINSTDDVHNSEIVNPLLSSFYQHQSVFEASEKVDQSTQTD